MAPPAHPGRTREARPGLVSRPRPRHSCCHATDGRHGLEGEAGERQEAGGGSAPSRAPWLAQGPLDLWLTPSSGQPPWARCSGRLTDQAGRRNSESHGPGVGSPSCHSLVTSGEALNVLTLCFSSTALSEGLPR